MVLIGQVASGSVRLPNLERPTVIRAGRWNYCGIYGGGRNPPGWGSLESKIGRIPVATGHSTVESTKIDVRYGRRHPITVITSGALAVIPTAESALVVYTRPSRRNRRRAVFLPPTVDNRTAMPKPFWKRRSTANSTGTAPRSCTIPTNIASPTH